MRQILMEWVLTSALLILAVTALRALLGRRISAGLRYALWAVVLVRLLVPVQLFTAPFAGTRFFSESRTEQTAAQGPITSDAHVTPGPDDGLSLSLPNEPLGNFAAAPPAPRPPTAPIAPEPPAAPDLTKAPACLGWIWLGGSIALALVLAASNLRFALRLRRVRVILEGADCPLPVYLAENLPSPCLFGLVRPSVYVTAENARNPVMLRHILAHEYTHFRHRDYVWNLLRSAALAVHWWNPLVWLAIILSRRDCELACDEGTLNRLGKDERIAYGRTLLALITAKPRPGDLLRCATTMTGGQKSVFDRVTRIARAPKNWLWAAVAAVIATALACVCAFGQAGPAEPSGHADDAAPTDAMDGIGTVLAGEQGNAHAERQEPDVSPSQGRPSFSFLDPASYTLTLNEYGTFMTITGLDCEYAYWNAKPESDFYDAPEHALGVLNLDSPRFLSERFSQYYAHCTALYSPADDPDLVWIAAYGDGDVNWFPTDGSEKSKELCCTVNLSTGEIINRKIAYPGWENAGCKLSNAEMVQAAQILAQLIREASDFYQASLPAPENGPLPFDVPMKLEFASGAGAWSTLITLHPDGSFEGNYHDMDMGDSGPGYGSTEYVCRFHGRFGEIRRVTNASWSMTLEELVIDTGHPIGEEWIEANPADRSHNLRYVSSAPYGFSKWDGEGMSIPLEPGAQFMFYTPEASGYRPTDELYGFHSANEDSDSVMYQFWHWMPSGHRIGAWGRDTRLGCYALCNMETGCGFFDLGAWGIG